MAQTITDELLGILMAHPHKSFSAEELADITGWAPKQCTGALVRLVNTYVDILRPTKGLYWYHPEPEPPEPVNMRWPSVSRQPLPEPEIVEPEHHHELDGAGGAVAVLREVSRQALPEVIEALTTAIPVMANSHLSVPTVFESVGVDEKGRIVLRDDKRRMWVATRLRADLS